LTEVDTVVDKLSKSSEDVELVGNNTSSNK